MLIWSNWPSPLITVIGSLVTVSLVTVLCAKTLLCRWPPKEDNLSTKDKMAGPKVSFVLCSPHVLYTTTGMFMYVLVFAISETLCQV